MLVITESVSHMCIIKEMKVKNEELENYLDQ